MAFDPQSALAIPFPPGEPWIRGVPPETRVQVRRLADRIAGGEWLPAANVLQELIEVSGHELIPIRHPREAIATRYVRLSDWLQDTFLDWPEDYHPLIRTYAALVDPLAGQLLGAGQDERQRADCEENERLVAAKYRLSSWGPLALDRVGESALAQGHFHTARNHWERLRDQRASPLLRKARLANAADSGADTSSQPLTTADIEARLVLVSMLADDVDRAEAELAAFRDRFRGERGWLAGRDGVLLDLLGQIDQTRRQARAQRRSFIPQPGSEIYRAVLSSSQSIPDIDATWRLAWRTSLATELHDRFNTLLESGTVTAAEASRPLLHPIWGDDAIFANDGFQLLAVDASTGRPLRGTSPRAVLFRPDSSSQTVDLSAVLCRSVRNLVADDARLVAIMVDSARRIDPNNQNATAADKSRLIALGLRSQKVEFDWDASESGGDLLGEPLLVGESIFVFHRQSGPRSTLALAAMDAATRRVLWHRVIGTHSASDDSSCTAASPSLVWCEGRIYANTGVGPLVATTTDGEFEWLTHVHSSVPPDGKAPPLDFPTYSVLDGDRWYVASMDRRVMGIDRGSGAVDWTVDIPTEEGPIAILGWTRKSVIATGRRLWRLDRSTGQAIEGGIQQPSGVQDKAKGVIIGRGLVLGSQLWLPVVKDDRNQIDVLDADSARPLRPAIELPGLERGRIDLLTKDGKVLAIGEEAMVVLEPED